MPDLHEQPEIAVSPPVQFRLNFYNLCQIRQDFVWVNPDGVTTLDGVFPDSIDDPNTFVVPVAIMDGEPLLGTIYSPEIGENTYNWGLLHSYVETLYLHGWRIEQL